MADSVGRVRFSRSFLFHPPWVEVGGDGESTLKTSNIPVGSVDWCTIAASSGISTAPFGGCSVSFTVDSVGDASKPVVVGLVPRTFTQFDEKMTAGGGIGLSSAGKFYCPGSKVDAPALKFGALDRVSLKLDFKSLQLTVTVENRKTKKVSGEQNFKLSSYPSGWLVPAVSVSCGGVAVSLEPLVDTATLDAFGARIATETDDMECDAFGSFYWRLHRRMNDGDVVKVTAKEQLSKLEVRCRAVLERPGCTPWGRNPLPGLLDADNTTRALAASVSDLWLQTLSDPSSARRLYELSKSPDSAKLIRRIGGPQALSLRAIASFIDMDRQENPSPATGGSASPASKDAGLLQQLLDRVSALEHSSAGRPVSPEDPFKRTASKIADNKKPPPTTQASTANLTARRASTVVPVKPKRPVVRAAPEKKVVVVTKPVATSISTSNAFLASLQKVRRTSHELRTMGEKGSPTDEDLKQMATLRDRLAREKMQAAKDINSMAISQPMAEEAKSDVIALLSEVVADGDQHPGNAEIVTAIIKKVPLDFAAIVRELGLASTAAYDGSLSFLRVFLGVSHLELDTVELVQSALFNQSHRIQVTNLLVDMATTIGLASVADEVAEVWQEFFDDICSNDRALAREDRSGRLELVTKLLKLKSPPVSPVCEGPDGQTAFTRAAREGDIDLMTVLLTTVPGMVDINRVSRADKTTALIQAVYKNQVTVVRALSSLPNIDLQHSCDEGTALSIAKTLRRHPDILRALEQAGAK